MNKPTPEQFKTVISKIDEVIPLAKLNEQFDMYEFEVSSIYHECGTVHCLAGWYAVSDINSKRLNLGKFGDITCEYGATSMTIDLGFDSIKTLTEWASNNPDIWGNEYGADMFSSFYAYNQANNLREARDHLANVHNRLCGHGDRMLSPYGES